MSYSILVVDDSEIVRKMVRKVIGMCGLEIGAIHEACNGLEAIEILSREWIDIVFADLHMPKMNGVELVRKMSENNLLVSIPVVIISSDRSQTRIDELKQHGIRAYIKKPFRPESFRDVVRDVLETAAGGEDGV